MKRSSASLIWASLAILFFVFALLLVVQIRNLSHARALDSDRHAAAIAIMTAPDAHIVSKPNALVIYSHSRGVALLASGLPRLAPAKIFEFWFLPPSSKGTVFEASPSHTAEIAAAVPPGSTSLIVTIEDEPGATSPAGPPLLTFPLE